MFIANFILIRKVIIINKIYDLIVTSNLYKSNIKVTATDLSSASNLAKIKFNKMFKQGNNIKVQLNPNDLRNHIDEILTSLVES